MKIIAVVVSLFALICFPAAGFADHPGDTTASKGTITKITAIEYEVTIKDDKGKETKVKVKEVPDVKVGDSVIVTKDGKVKKAVMPKTGGY